MTSYSYDHDETGAGMLTATWLGGPWEKEDPRETARADFGDPDPMMGAKVATVLSNLSAYMWALRFWVTESMTVESRRPLLPIPGPNEEWSDELVEAVADSLMGNPLMYVLPVLHELPDLVMGNIEEPETTMVDKTSSTTATIQHLAVTLRHLIADELFETRAAVALQVQREVDAIEASLDGEYVGRASQACARRSVRWLP